MSNFDPYYKWLAIPPKDQPPNHYRLLALEVYESDRDVISTAADQRMMLVRSFQTGDHQRFSQQILKEIAVARLCLLDADRKAAYDSQLQREQTSTAHPARRSTAQSQPSGAIPPRPGSATAVAPLPVNSLRELTTARGRGRKPSSRLLWGLAAVGMLVAAGIVYLLRGNAPQGATGTTAQDTGVKTPTSGVGEKPPPTPPPLQPAHDGKQVAPPQLATPVLRLRQIPLQRTDEGSVLRIQASLEEPSANGADNIRFGLGPNVPPGLAIDSATGVVTWQPAEEQGPGRYSVEITATDGKSRADTTAPIEVLEVNDPPHFRAIPDQTGVPGRTLQRTIEATDGDLPQQSLNYELISAPPDSKLDATTGQFTWTPRSEQAGQNFEARVRVKDSASGHADIVVGLLVAQSGVAPGGATKDEVAKDSGRAVPKAEAVQAAMQQVQKLFADEIAKAADNPALRLKLVEKLVKEADGTTDDPAGRYALYRQAMQQARLAGDAAAMVQSIDALAKWYDIDALEEKQQAVSELSKGVRSEETATELVSTILALVDEAVEQENWDRATNFIRIATAVVPKTRDSERRKAVSTRGREIGMLKKMHGEVQQAHETLRRDAQDAASHRIVGIYQALVRGDWDAGLPHLAQGDDISTSSAAQKELQNPIDSAAMKEVADAWGAVLKNKHAATPTLKTIESIASARNHLRKHALKWHEAALPGLTGLSKRATEQQINELKEEVPEVGGKGHFKTVTFDFGTTTSPLEEDAIRITEQSGYERQHGYGFVGSRPASIDRAAPATTALKRDLCYAPDMTFGVDVPAGVYSVTVTIGDVGSTIVPMDLMLEGTVVGAVPQQAAANAPFYVQTFKVNVTDGQLTLRIKRQGTANVNAKINGLTVKQIR